MATPEIRPLAAVDASRLPRDFAGTPWVRSESYFQEVLEKQDRGERRILVALVEDRPRHRTAQADRGPSLRPTPRKC